MDIPVGVDVDEVARSIPTVSGQRCRGQFRVPPIAARGRRAAGPRLACRPGFDVVAVDVDESQMRTRHHSAGAAWAWLGICDGVVGDDREALRCRVDVVDRAAGERMPAPERVLVAWFATG